MKKFREIALNESIFSDLKKLSGLSDQIANLDEFQAIVKNVKVFLSTKNDNFKKVERLYNFIKQEVEEFKVKINKLDKALDIDVLKNTVKTCDDLLFTLQRKYTEATTTAV